MYQPHADQQYIEALLRNDSQLVADIYRRHADKITGMVVQNNGTPEDAADIMQEALMDIYKKAKTGNFILTCPLDAFLYLVCRNKWLMELRKRKNMPVTFTDTVKYEPGEDARQVTEQLTNDRLRRELLMEKVNELKDGCKQLLQMSWAGMPMQEVARVMQMSYGYARRKKGECLGKLITMIKKTASFNTLKQ
jgi:RNA polymerase sigma factor (sigma-70 family)